MSFARQAAGAVLPFGLLGNALLKKDKPDKIKPQASMITEGTPSTSSLIGTTRGGY